MVILLQTIGSYPVVFLLTTLCSLLLLLTARVTQVWSTSQYEGESAADNNISSTILLRNRRETWKIDDLFVCYVYTEDDSLVISLTCDQLLRCNLQIFLRDDVPYFKPLPPLHLLSDNCTDVFNPFRAYIPRNKTFDKYYLKQNQIRELTLQFTYKTVFNPGYFCNLQNIISMTFHNVLYDMQSLGFGKSCSSSECCVCNLKNLTITSNSNLTVISDSFFCGMQNLTTLILNSNNIAKIEDRAFFYLPSLEKLELKNNKFVTLSQELFHTLKMSVRYLDVSNNRLHNDIFCPLQSLTLLEDLKLNNISISVLNGDCIKGLTSLKRLELKNNKITTLGEELHLFNNLEEVDLFGNMILSINGFNINSMLNLSVLILSRNNLSSINDFALNENYKLKKLDISRNEIHTIPSTLKYLKNLTHLDLACNKIDAITENHQRILCNITNLEYLSLEHTEIREIIPGAFSCNANLKILNLNSNMLKTIVAMKFSKVTHLFVKNNEIKNISLEDLPTSLVNLDASDNKISSFHFNYADSAVSGRDIATMPDLQFMDLNHNVIETFSVSECSPTAVRIAKTPTRTGIYAHSCLPEIDLKHNLIKSVCPFVLKILQKSSVPNVDLNRNLLLCSCEVRYLRQLYNTFLYYSSTYATYSCNLLFPPVNSSIVTVLNRYNLLDNFTCSEGNSYKKYLRYTADGCPCNLHPEYSKSCGLSCPNGCKCFISNQYDLYLIDCSNLNFIALPHFEQTMNFTKISNFAGNQLSFLNASQLFPYTNSLILDLHNNYLRSIANNSFINFGQLEILNLKNNLLTKLGGETFLGLKRLKELDLSNNRLVNIYQGSFRPLESVRNLTIRNNQLNEIPTSELINLKSSLVQGIDLASNPWSCDCDFALSFREWLENSSSLVKEAETLYCLLNDSRISLINFNNSNCYDVKDRIIQLNDVAMWMSIMSVVMFVTILIIVSYLYRKEMQVLIYSRYGVRLFQKKEDVDANKKFDVFIAYSSLDEDFVVEMLLPGLEEIEKPYKVCVHQRDFMVGAIITESILEAVEVSSRTIVVLSENFVESGFCRFEFKSAHLQMLSDRCARLIVIILGGIPTKLDPEMKLYLKTNTYLQWGDLLFWEKLYFALPDRNQALA